MIIGAKIQLTGHLAALYGPRGAWEDKLRRYEQGAFEIALRKWHRRMLPEHFEPNAKQVYRYERRTPAYERRKQRVKGHNRYLMWSGASRNLAMRRIDIRATKKSATGTVHVAKAFNFSGRSGMPDMKGEVTRILKREKKVLLELIHDEIVRKLNPAGDECDLGVRVIAI